MDEDDIRERQEFEVEAIKAIYLSDVKDLRSNINDPPALAIRLLPQRGSSGGERREFSPTTVLMSVKMPSDYPNVVPLISLSEVKGLSSQEVAELHKELDKLAAGSVGEVMVLNLAQYAEGYLHLHQKTPTGSFYDEMILRKKLLQEQSNQKKQDHFEKERLAIREEIQRKQDALKEEIKRRKEEWKAQNEMKDKMSPPANFQLSPVKGDGFPQNIPVIPKYKKRRSISIRRRRSTSEGSDSSLSEYSDIITLDFSCHKNARKFQRGELLGESEKGSKVYAGMDCTTGSLVAISEWNFPIGKRDKKGRLIKEVGGGEGHSPSYDTVLKQLNAFESEFNLLQKLEHSNIVLYLGIKVMATEDTGCACLFVAQEFIRGTTLKSYLQDMLSLDMAVVRHIAQGILQALDYLHSNNVVHRFLRDSSIFVDTAGEVKVGDYGLERKICEFHQNATGNHDVQIDKFPPSIGRGAKKGDVYRFGVLILSLLQGRPVTQNPPDIPTNVPNELQDFLKKCLTTNEHVRWTATQLLEHTFLKMQLQRGPIMRCFREMGSHYQENKEPVDHDKEMDSKMFLPISKESSRLQNEFEMIQWLGKGGFGDVLKVRNKLDGGIYALKRIRLNPRNRQLNKKITREVKLLSQLNHENVVRYFNSWIETVVGCASDDASSTTQTVSTHPTGPDASAKTSHSVRFKLDGPQQNSLGFDDDIEAMAPPLKDSEWSISVRDNVEESDESSEEEDIFGTSFLHLGSDDESDGIVFESQSDTSYNNKDSEPSSSKLGSEVEVVSEKVKDSQAPCSIMAEIQYMYIQMEFCEKSTLRTAIDNGLYQDGDRVWRLFREIVEGLVHIHQQGMIHRDLKPVNIFLDSNDHVKIGDFGLATTNILNKTSGEAIIEGIKPDVQQSMDFGEESMTGHVGTALYVAPELITTSAKAMYNQKVDIYSLGVILFEMFYRPLETGMERVRIIAGLRQKDIQFPSDFDEQLLPQVAYLLRWVLNHDPSKRPTSVELLQSDYMPPPLMEETELHDMFRHTLSNPQSKAYKYLVASCFHQTVSTAEDITYNYRFSDTAPVPGELLSSFTVMNKTRKVIQNVFERHGAVEFSAPLLTPFSCLYVDHKDTVHLMSHSGGIVTIPFDLRVPFARYVVWNQIPNFKRYCIGKVFRENKVFGCHPRELYECAFDVVSPNKGTLICDAETLAVTFEIINELPWLRHKEFTIRISHTFFLDAVLLHFGIDEKYYSEIKSILAAIKPDRHSKSQIQTHLVSLCLPDPFISMLFTLMEIEGPLAKVSNVFKGVLKKKGLAATKVKEGMHEVETLIAHLEAFAPKCEVVVTPSVIFGTNVYTGLLFQVVCNLKKRKNKQTVDVVAVGGRYDNLLEKFRSTLEMYGQISKDITQSGVGISISLDKLVAGLEKEERDRYGANRTVDAIVCSMGHHAMSREKITIMKDFLANGIQCIVLDEAQTLESAEEHCRQLGALFIVILKETEDLRVRSLEKDRFQERRVTRAEAVDFILRTRRASESSDMLGSTGSVKWEGQQRTGGQLADLNGIEKAHPQPISSASVPAVNISFVLQEKDKLASWKRRYENQMISHIEGVLPKLSRQQVVELVGLDVTSAVIKSLALLQLQDKEEYRRSVGEVVEKHPRHKKYVETVCDLIYELNFEREKNSPVIIVYGLLDNYFRILI